MLSTDTIIVDILETAKQNGEELLEDFEIEYPSNRVLEESNSIFVGVMSSEANINGFEFETFTDLVEILIVTKQRDYIEAITLIKNISRLVCGLILKNKHLFPNKPVIRNINPEFNRDFVLTRGHIMVQVRTEPVTFDLSEEDYNVCKIILDKNNIETD